MSKVHRWLARVTPVVVLLLTPLALAAQDLPDGAEDYPLISPYEGSEMYKYEHFDYDLMEVATETEDGELEKTPIEGEVTRILYAAPGDEDLSVLQVHRNYQMALQEAGFEIYKECAGMTDSCEWSDYSPARYKFGMSDYYHHAEDHSYLLARKPDTEGDVYIMFHTFRPTFFQLGALADRPNTILQVVEEKPMDTGKTEATLSADAMAEDLEEEGTVQIYGIHFDTDEATVRDESASTLTEIAEFLEQHPDLTVAVVGHTDTQGSFEHNMELSARRAEAVVKQLTDEYGVAADRLQAHGVGWLAPVATNATEEGRAQNRRVELVELP